ncbi:hypothetical protein QJS04_geneDACA020530 [Acorus gramineus]|uniref:Uncharacterized protein n=1 Tax=Acorus gramineus TaxID=55184 RepID=A0AAV9ABP6_ACOGR|nr:hypothetical protein QJS04_geneDACA020530 [Acorus gramineus]
MSVISAYLRLSLPAHDPEFPGIPLAHAHPFLPARSRGYASASQIPRATRILIISLSNSNNKKK